MAEPKALYRFAEIGIQEASQFDCWAQLVDPEVATPDNNDVLDTATGLSKSNFSWNSTTGYLEYNSSITLQNTSGSTKTFEKIYVGILPSTLGQGDQNVHPIPDDRFLGEATFAPEEVPAGESITLTKLVVKNV